MTHLSLRRCASRLLLLPFLALAALLPACQTGQSFPSPTASWQTYTGQMHYGGARSVVGEVVVRRSGSSDFQLAFSAGPGLVLMRVWESGGNGRTEGALSRGSWQGSPSHAPAHLREWLSLRELFNAVPKAGGTFSGSFGKADALVVNGRLQHLTVTSPSGREHFTFHFGP